MIHDIQGELLTVNDISIRENYRTVRWMCLTFWLDLTLTPPNQVIYSN